METLSIWRQMNELLDKYSYIGGKFQPDTRDFTEIKNRLGNIRNNRYLEFSDIMDVCNSFFDNDTDYFEKDEFKDVIKLKKLKGDITLFEIRPTLFNYDINGYEGISEVQQVYIERGSPQKWEVENFINTKDLVLILFNAFIKDKGLLETIEDYLPGSLKDAPVNRVEERVKKAKERSEETLRQQREEVIRVCVTESEKFKSWLNEMNESEKFKSWLNEMNESEKFKSWLEEIKTKMASYKFYEMGGFNAAKSLVKAKVVEILNKFFETSDFDAARSLVIDKVVERLNELER
jgi:hypothetical protein